MHMQGARQGRLLVSEKQDFSAGQPECLTPNREKAAQEGQVRSECTAMQNAVPIACLLQARFVACIATHLQPCPSASCGACSA